MLASPTSGELRWAHTMLCVQGPLLHLSAGEPRPPALGPKPLCLRRCDLCFSKYVLHDLKAKGWASENQVSRLVLAMRPGLVYTHSHRAT